MMKIVRKIRLMLILFAALASAAFAADRPPGQAGDPLIVDAEAIRRHLEDFIDSRREVLPQADIRFKKIEMPAAFSLPQGRLEVEVVPSDPQIVTSRRFTLLFRVDGRVERNLAIRAELEAIAPVVVAGGDLGRGALLSERDLNLAQMDLIGLRNPCFDLQELVGQKLKQAVRLGTPLDRSQIDFPPLIKRGDAVSITLQQGGLHLTVVGEARQNGRAGETIPVRNSSSRRDILCRVIAPGQVEVEF